jgi:hypothetical protein
MPPQRALLLAESAFSSTTFMPRPPSHLNAQRGYLPIAGVRSRVPFAEASRQLPPRVRHATNAATAPEGDGRRHPILAAQLVELAHRDSQEGTGLVVSSTGSMLAGWRADTSAAPLFRPALVRLWRRWSPSSAPDGGDFCRCCIRERSSAAAEESGRLEDMLLDKFPESIWSVFRQCKRVAKARFP